jgi:hypothetical protein
VRISAIDRAVLAGTVALGFSFAASQTTAWPAPAEACHDSGTCTIVTDSRQRLNIRQHGVDAPELGQPYGPPSGWLEHFNWTHSWARAR